MSMANLVDARGVRTLNVRDIKVIDGLLDVLPASCQGWTEEDLQQWMLVFESALRVIFQLPRQEPQP